MLTEQVRVAMGDSTKHHIAPEPGPDRELALAQRRVRHLAAAAPDGIVFVDAGTRIVWCSESMSPVIGWPTAVLEGRPIADLVEPEDITALRGGLRAAFSGGSTTSVTVRMTTVTGQLRWFALWLSLASDHGPDGLPPEVMISVRDIHEQRPEVLELARRTTRDPLTGLGNRSGLRRYLDELSDSGASVVLAHCDVDGFRAINDRFGHATGDRVLETVANRLARVAASVGRVFRLGGDEFIIAVPNLGERASSGLVSRVHEAMRPSIETPVGDLAVSLSAGAAFTAKLDDVPALLEMAQEAMYRARASGDA